MPKVVDHIAQVSDSMFIRRALPGFERRPTHGEAKIMK